MSSPESAILLIHAPDQKGLVASVAEFLYRHRGNILHADQHQDSTTGQFLMRVEWALKGFDLDLEQFPGEFAAIAGQFGMKWRLARSTHRVRLAIFVSRYDHCLADLLYRVESGELHCEVALVISNHPEAGRLAAFHRIPFFHIPVSAHNKTEAEARQLQLLEDHGVELVVLARYMQVLSSEFVRKFEQNVINVHHSFLPAFSGARPYHRAYERGVKLIGATSHYVTDELDEGPIIEQDVVRISHRDQIDNLVQKGRDLEKIVLARAVRWHVEHRVLLYSNKTVVFD